jgi:hypothetical protein
MLTMDIANFYSRGFENCMGIQGVLFLFPIFTMGMTANVKPISS